MQSPFHRKQAEGLRTPAPSVIPQMEAASLAAQYRAARTGGDFFDFQSIDGRLVFLLLDIAGRREQALHIAAAVQERFHAEVRELFAASPLNEADALSHIAVHLNRAIMEAAQGVHCAPAFFGSYDEDMGIVFYINAGHTPGLLRDTDEVQRLPANGLPLGLFSHSTHDAQTCVLAPGAALLMVSKGLVESRGVSARWHGRQEFGMERVEQALKQARFTSAGELCSEVLAAVQTFTKTPGRNDMTTLALMRSPAAVATELASAATAP